MNETHGPASPLPEGRADGESALRQAIEAALAVTGEVSCAGYSVDDDGCYVAVLAARVRAAAAAPVVAVPEAGERERCRCGHPRHQHDGWDDAVMECERCSCDVFEHPEPGDRAERWHQWRAAVDNPQDFGDRRTEACMALADAEVAAAVAAVRADLARQVLSLRHYGAVGDATFNDGLERAAALIRGRS